jgi:hypothetical protein
MGVLKKIYHAIDNFLDAMAQAYGRVDPLTKAAMMY